MVVIVVDIISFVLCNPSRVRGYCSPNGVLLLEFVYMCVRLNGVLWRVYLKNNYCMFTNHRVSGMWVGRPSYLIPLFARCVSVL